jgi:hypothetical protein
MNERKLFWLGFIGGIIRIFGILMLVLTAYSAIGLFGLFGLADRRSVLPFLTIWLSHQVLTIWARNSKASLQVVAAKRTK